MLLSLYLLGVFWKHRGMDFLYSLLTSYQCTPTIIQRDKMSPDIA